MTQRLQSFYSSHRKDAAYTLGRLHDPRAIPSLIHVLKYDSSKDVRIASAIALGEIGGSDSAVALERCAIYDKKEDVRKAATNALERLNAQAKNAPPLSSEVAPLGRSAAPSGHVKAFAVPGVALRPRLSRPGRRARRLQPTPPDRSRPHHRRPSRRVQGELRTERQSHPFGRESSAGASHRVRIRVAGDRLELRLGLARSAHRERRALRLSTQGSAMALGSRTPDGS